MIQNAIPRHLRSGAHLLLPLLLGSCADDTWQSLSTPADRGLPIQLSASILQNSETRADESGFADGDRFGVFVVNYDGSTPGALTLSDNQANNVAFQYAADAGTWSAASDIYWRDAETPVDVYGYYPFTNGIGDTSAFRFEVEANQTAAPEGEMCAYEASDFLWAKASAAKPGNKVNLFFRHVMAGVKVTLQQGSGFDGDAWSKLQKSVSVDNTLRTAEINLSTGVATPTGSFDRNVAMNPEAADTYRAVVVPQTVAAGKSTIGITVDGTTYHYNRPDGMTYTSGKLHNFTIKIDRKAEGGAYTLTLVSEDITDWIADQSSHDFEANSYLVVNVPTAGTLKECLADVTDDPSYVKNLKIEGTLTDTDFDFIREKMSASLCAINLKSVKMATITKNIWEWNPELHKDEYKTVTLVDELPEEALQNMSKLTRVILPESLKSLARRSLHSLYLSSDLVLPDGITEIKGYALSYVRGNVTVNIPKSVERIETEAFEACGARVRFQLPASLKHIGFRAFYGCVNAEGVFTLPESLEYIGDGAFQNLGENSKLMTGKIEIPSKITKIPESAFREIGFQTGTQVSFHDGVTEIGSSAFSGTTFLAPVGFPANLRIVGSYAFYGCKFVGDVVLPDGLLSLGECVFSNSNLKGTLTLPAGIETITPSTNYINSGLFTRTMVDKLILSDNLLQIGAKAFQNSGNLQYVKIGKYVEFIDDGAFTGCGNLSTVVCLANTPPALGSAVFQGVDVSHCVLEVPENAVESYRSDSGWKVFSNITPHHELGLSTTQLSSLNNGLSFDVDVRAEGPWEIAECPSWIHVSPDHAQNKEKVTVKIDKLAAGAGDRSGKVVFRLKDSGYTNYLSVSQLDYDLEEDREIVLQAASGNGKPIPLIILGEGFGAESIANGKYMERINDAMEQLFAVEPYKTYRNMFSVSTAIAMSVDDGAEDILTGKNTKFKLTFPDLSDRRWSLYDMKDYVCNTFSGVDSRNIDNALILVVANYNAFNGSSFIDDEGCSFALVGNSDDTYPCDNRGLVQYYAGGEAFAGLASEAVAHIDNIKGCSCPLCNQLDTYYEMKDMGFFENVTISGKTDNAPWREFIFNPKYSSIVDMYEGGYNHFRGVWRSEPESVMSTFISYYNTISRYSIYKQIMRRAGLSASLENFIANDKIEIPQ